MTLTVTKKFFQKYKPRIIKFRVYRNFQNNILTEDLLSELLNFNVEISDEGFTEIFEASNKHHLTITHLAGRNMLEAIICHL